MSIKSAHDVASPASIAPASRHAMPPVTGGGYRSFLSDVVIEHGPRDVLSRTFLLGDTQLREMGIRLSFGTFEDLVAVNRANRDSWSPILPLFDPALNDLDANNGIVLLGRSAAGKVVVTCAARRYDLGQSTLADEIESLRLLYRDPASSALPGEEIRVSSPVAKSTRGIAVFSGAVWVHPEWRRGRLLDATLPVLRALGLTIWYPGLTFSFVVPELAGSAPRWRMNTDWEITMINTPVRRSATIHAALTWTRPDLIVQHCSDFVQGGSGGAGSEVDRRINERAPDEQRVAGRRGQGKK